MKIYSFQLVAYLLSNIDELVEALGCKESDLKESLSLLSNAPDLLEACKNIVKIFGCQRMLRFAKCRENNMCSICAAKAATTKAEPKT